MNSSARRDKLVVSLSGSIPLEHFSWSSVEFSGDEVEVVLGVGGEVLSFGEELADEPVPVFVAAPLPRRPGVTEKDGDAGVDPELDMAGEFAALVPGE